MTAPDVDRPVIDFALYFAAHGFRVLPIRPRSKAPTLKDWPNQATTDPVRITEWFDQRVGGNYGIITAGLVVIDIDPRHGGHHWLEEHEHLLPDTLRFRTGSGGWHIVLKAPNGREIGNRAGIAPGVDIRGDGGQIVGPGSIHPDGGLYTIEVGPDDVDLAETPTWLIELIDQPKTNGQAGEPVDLNTGPIPEGKRDHTLTRICGHLLKVLPETRAGDELHWINEARCQPPLARQDIDRIISSIGKREADKARQTATFPTTAHLGDPFHKLLAPPLPRNLLPPVLEAFAEREARTKGVEFAAPAMAGLTVCAAAIPDHVRLRVKVHETWQESARLWLALIGLPSALKSPVIRTAMQPLKQLEKAAFARWRQAKVEWDKTSKEERGPEPTVQRYVLNDTTIESAGRILAENPLGLLLERDELAGWFGSMDKYSGGRGAAADRGFWLQAWNGGDYTVDRISRVSCHIPNLSVSIIGGVQPDAIRRVVADAVDDGLIQRLIPISIGPASVGEDSPDVAHAFRDYNDLVHRLAGLPEQSIVFNTEAQELRRAFERHAQDLLDLEALSPQLAAFCGKLNGLFARLALTLHCCDNQPPGEQINADVAQRVTRLMRETIIPHALRFYLDSETGILADARSIAGWILGKQVERLTFGALTTSVRACRGKGRDEVRRMLEPLEMFNWIAPDDRNQPRAWTVNPQVHERFADRAEQERGRRKRIGKLLKEWSDHE